MINIGPKLYAVPSAPPPELQVKVTGRSSQTDFMLRPASALASASANIKSFTSKFWGPHYYQTSWCFWLMFGMIIDTGPKFYAVPSPPSTWPKVTGRSSQTDFMLRPASALALASANVKSFTSEFWGPHYYQTSWCFWFMFGMIIDTGPKFYAVPSPPSTWPLGQGHTDLEFFMLKFYFKALGPHYFQTLWYILFMFGIIDNGQKFYEVPSLHELKVKVLIFA